MRKSKSRTAVPTPPATPTFEPLNPPDPSLPYLFLATSDDPRGKFRDGHAVEVGPGSTLPPEAGYWCYPGGKWILIQWVDPTAPEPAPEPPSYIPADPNITPPVDHVLYASKNITTVWLPTTAPNPVPLTHPDEDADALFYRCDLTFLSWLRGRLAKARSINRALTPHEEFQVDGICLHICYRNGINDDNWQTAMPAPGASLPT